MIFFISFLWFSFVSPFAKEDFFNNPAEEKYDLKALRDNYAKLKYAHAQKIREAYINEGFKSN